MNLLGIGEIIGGVGKIADDLITTDKERLTLAIEEKKIEAGLIQSQIEVNKAEAQHASVFVAGWRPFIGWVGGFGMAYQFLLYPLLTWVWPILIAAACRPAPPSRRCSMATCCSQWSAACSASPGCAASTR
jgi:hypothetical protein